MASTRIGETVRHIHVLFSGKSVAGQGDASLLRRFVAGQDEEAFGVIVARHGPMVWAVCRDILRDPRDVEDAFQTTFLALVRRAGSLWVEESLGGWLYRVAYNTALRVRRNAGKLREREQPAADLSVVAETSTDTDEFADLHEAIARLPERFRKPLVMCDLEGMPQLEAAQLLRCGEATLRRRLAHARERLKNHLSRHGALPMLLNRLQLRMSTQLPAGWLEATARAARFVRPVSSSLMKFAGVLIVASLVSALSIASAQSRDEPRPVAVMPKPAAPTPEVKKAIVTTPVRWFHFKSDRGDEGWANCDTGIEVGRFEDRVTMVDAAKRERLEYEKDSKSIVKSRLSWLSGQKDELGRYVVPSGDDLVLKPTLRVPSRTPDALRAIPMVLPQDFNFDTVDGRKMIRLDVWERDALGALRIRRQAWYDAETRCKVREKKRYQLGEQQQYGKVFQTIDYDYPETGPSELAALGVPKNLPIVDSEKQKSSRIADQAPEIRRVIEGEIAAIRKFPRNLRVVTKDRRGVIHLEYTSVTENYVNRYCNRILNSGRGSLPYSQGQNFRADNQNFGERPDDLFPTLKNAPDGSFDSDRVAAWFPVKKSTNTGLATGEMTYHLTRFGENDLRVHVMDDSYDSFPQLFDEQWSIYHRLLMNLEVMPSAAAVSYTHLTLPTICSV